MGCPRHAPSHLARARGLGWSPGAWGCFQLFRGQRAEPEVTKGSRSQAVFKRMWKSPWEAFSGKFSEGKEVSPASKTRNLLQEHSVGSRDQSLGLNKVLSPVLVLWVLGAAPRDIPHHVLDIPLPWRPQTRTSPAGCPTRACWAPRLLLACLGTDFPPCLLPFGT